MSMTSIALFISIFTLGILLQHVSVAESISNATQLSGEKNALSPLETEVEIHERYRRLLPYMSYYIVNNYVAPQHQVASYVQPYVHGQSQNSIFQRPTLQQHVSPRPNQLKPKHQTHKSQENRFVPSVQYDPKEFNLDSNYFVPVNYGNKDGYNDYISSNIRTNRPPAMSIMSNNGYDTTSRPVNFLLQKQKQPLIKVQHEYMYRQDPEEFESIRFMTPSQVNLRQQPVRYVQPIVSKPTVSEPVSPVARVSLNHIFKSLQLTNQLPEVLNKDNIDSSIKTLVEILNILNMDKKEDYTPDYEKIKSTYIQPKIITESNYEATQISATPRKEYIEIKHIIPYANQIKTNKSTEHEEINVQSITPYINLIKAQTPISLPTNTKHPNVANKIVEYYVPIIQDIDEQKVALNIDKEHSISQSSEKSNVNYDITEDNDEVFKDERYNFPITINEKEKKLSKYKQNIPPTLKYGATRGKPHIDYPAYTDIPETEFSCKQQRYKGFFGDPATGCQVWHYCDLNGGKSSFLCPNGTIFSQVALTCDWWFNVKCESTTQLYVLNERLYKYILPIMPKFPEDFTGPEVDRYLELKFKEMKSKLKENKMKKEQEEKGKSTINTLQSIEDSK